MNYFIFYDENWGSMVSVVDVVEVYIEIEMLSFVLEVMELVLDY
jgi:hypothetical protein